MHESEFFIKYPKEYHHENLALTEIILIQVSQVPNCCHSRIIYAKLE